MKDNKIPKASLFQGLKSYLTDWKNLLGHALLGVLFLVLAIWAPLNIYVKLVIIAALITFNIWRMKRKKNIPKDKIQSLNVSDSEK